MDYEKEKDVYPILMGKLMSDYHHIKLSDNVFISMIYVLNVINLYEFKFSEYLHLQLSDIEVKDENKFQILTPFFKYIFSCYSNDNTTNEACYQKIFMNLYIRLYDFKMKDTLNKMKNKIEAEKYDKLSKMIEGIESNKLDVTHINTEYEGSENPSIQKYVDDVKDIETTDVDIILHLDEKKISHELYDNFIELEDKIEKLNLITFVKEKNKMIHAENLDVLEKKSKKILLELKYDSLSLSIDQKQHIEMRKFYYDERVVIINKISERYNRSYLKSYYLKYKLNDDDLIGDLKQKYNEVMLLNFEYSFNFIFDISIKKNNDYFIFLLINMLDTNEKILRFKKWIHLKSNEKYYLKLMDIKLFNNDINNDKIKDILKDKEFSNDDYFQNKFKNFSNSQNFNLFYQGMTESAEDYQASMSNLYAKVLKNKQSTNLISVLCTDIFSLFENIRDLKDISIFSGDDDVSNNGLFLSNLRSFLLEYISVKLKSSGDNFSSEKILKFMYIVNKINFIKKDDLSISFDISPLKMNDWFYLIRDNKEFINLNNDIKPEYFMK